MSRRVVVSPRSELRAREATAWLAAREAGREVLVVGATSDAAGEAIRAVALARGSAFGMHRLTLGRLAAELAKHELVERDLAAVGGLPIEALCARVVQRMRRDGALGRFEVVADKPGLPRALARTLGELRLAGATPAVVREHSAELAAALVALELELAAARLADRAIVYRLATEVVADRARQGLLIGLDAVWIDVPVRSAVEQALIAAIAGRAESALATVPFGDDGSEKRLAAALGVGSERLTSATISAGSELDPGAATPADERKSSLARVQAQLFAPRRERAELDDSIEIFSAPGESRECVEIARRVLHAAERGVPFDRMAVLLRTTESYRVHLEEAFARAAIPVHFDQGTRLPDPTGRAFLALLACAGERLSVRRFAEYLSLGEVPATSEPPPAVPSGDRWVPPEEELLPIALAGGDEDDEDDELGEILVVRGRKPPSREELARALGLGTAATSASESTSTSTSTATNTNPGTGSGSGTGTSESTGQVFAPWRWEQLLVDAAVIGGLDRWERRLDGLEAQLQLEDSEHGRDRRERALADLRQLRAFAIPLLRDLAALPAYATWGQWIDLLSALATRALRKPDRVMTILSALQPMAEVGPIELREVQLVLGERLAELVVRPPGSRYGKLVVAPIEAARGRSFDLVFVPGLAERMFPQKLVEDPLLLDLARTDLPLALDRRDDRVLAERLALRLALGAATERVVLSYPRIDLEQGRPRVPSFYGLEILEAGEGALPGFDDLGRRANVTGAARIGWPAPGAPIDAIDEAEHDLALLDTLVHDPAQLSLLPETRKPVPKMGAAHYLLGANAHLARALRTRARRWDVRAWKPADGLIVSTPEGRAALAAHSPDVRSFSPTALEQFAACPYRFVLRTIVRLEPREAPEPIETIDPLERGSLVHEVQFELLGELRALGLLPVTEVGLTTARDLLDAVLDRVAARYRDKLFPAIERVWNDAISSIRADLREWLRRMADDGEWTPARFELAFGLDTQTGRDPASRDEPVPTAIGLTLRGSIDLVERGSNGRVRATDYKTGKAKVAPGSVIGGGKSLQPVLYALVLEKMLPEAQVEGGRLYYCTTRGDFQDVSVPLDETALASANLLASTLRHHFERGFFPAAPDKGECTYCDFRAVCGPYEEQRSHRKAKEPLVQLRRLREQR